MRRLARERAESLEAEVEAQHDEDGTDHRGCDPLDAFGAMRLVTLGGEAPDQRDGRDRIDGRIEPEPQQRQATGRERDDNGRAAR